MQLKDWLHQSHGRQAALARSLGIKPPQVADWVSGDKPIPVHHMAAIEQFTQGEVTRQELRPDDWQRIWPELGRPPVVAELATKSITKTRALETAQEVS